MTYFSGLLQREGQNAHRVCSNSLASWSCPGFSTRAVANFSLWSKASNIVRIMRRQRPEPIGATEFKAVDIIPNINLRSVALKADAAGTIALPGQEPSNVESAPAKYHLRIFNRATGRVDRSQQLKDAPQC